MLSNLSILMKLARCSKPTTISWKSCIHGRIATFCSRIDHKTVEASNTSDKSWIQSADAQSIIKVFKVPPKDSIKAEDILDYLQQRVPESNSVFHTDRKSDSAIETNPALRNMSFLLTFPLTLAYGISKVYSGKEKNTDFPNEEMMRIMDAEMQQDSNNKNDLKLDATAFAFSPHSNTLRVLVVGARAESSLPLQWWQECLYYASGESIECIELQMIGPDVLPRTGVRKQGKTEENDISNVHCHEEEATWNRENNDRKVFKLKTKLFINRKTPKEQLGSSNIGMDTGADKTVSTNAPRNAFDRNLLHGHPDGHDMLRWADAIVLFNPGFGSEPLREAWDPTLRMLIQCKKPVVCTALSSQDLARDLATLDTVQLEEDYQDLGGSIEILIQPQVNPYGSSKLHFDGKETPGKDGSLGAQLTRTNHSIYAFQGFA